MQTQIQDLSLTQKSVRVTVAKQDLSKFLNRAYQKVGQKAKIPGFRPGKIPANVLDRHYGADVNYECVNFLIDDAYRSVLKDNDLFPVDEPKFDVKPLDRDADYEFGFELTVKPKFELKPYTGLTLKKRDVVIKDEDLQAEYKLIQDRMTQLKPAAEGESLRSGLVGAIDFAGTVDGKAFEGGTATDFQIDLDKKTMLEEFSTKITGMKVGEERTIQVTFPEDYFGKELQGKTAEFKITLKTLHGKEVPALDDELAKDLELESFAALTERVTEMLKRNQEHTLRRESAQEARELLKSAYDFEVPPSLVAKNIERTKLAEAEAAAELRLEFVLEAIAKQEAFQVTAAEVEGRISALAQMYRQPAAELQKYFQKNGLVPNLVFDILVDKALDHVVSKANFA